MKNPFKDKLSFSKQTSKDNGYTRAMIGSVLLHVVFIVAVLINWQPEPEHKFVQPKPISATLVTLPPVSKPTPAAVVKKPPSVDKAAQEKARLAAEQKAIALKKQQEKEKQLALKKQQEQAEQEKEKKRAQEVARKKEEAKKRAELARKRQQQEARAKAAAEAELQALIENQALAEQNAQALDQQQLAQAQQLEFEQLEQIKYAGLIRQLISQYWNRPLSARNNMEAEVRIQLSSFGDLLSVTLSKPSKDEAFNHSVLQAVKNAAPFSELRKMDRSVFNKHFKTVTFRFRPEDLMQ